MRLSTRFGVPLGRLAITAFLPRRYRFDSTWMGKHIHDWGVRYEMRTMRQEIDAAGDRLFDLIRGDQHGDDTDRDRHRDAC